MWFCCRRLPRRMDEVLAFLLEAWHHLGLPAQVQFDNAREFCSWGKVARYLSRVIRLCLCPRVTPIFIPQRRPQRNGAVENFNGWFQPLLFRRHFKYPAVLRRELARLMTTVNEQHIQSRLGQRTVAQCRRSKCLRRLPVQFHLDTDHLPISEGRVIFIRQVPRRGKITLLGQTFRVGPSHKFNYVKLVLDTRRQRPHALCPRDGGQQHQARPTQPTRFDRAACTPMAVRCCTNCLCCCKLFMRHSFHCDIAVLSI